MTKETMTVHEALTTLKTLDKRISDNIIQGMFVDTAKHSFVECRPDEVKTISNSIFGAYDSVTALINRRAAIRKALAYSNAYRIVSIAGKDYAVSEAIEMKKTGIEMQKLLLDTMTKQLAAVDRKIKTANDVTVPKDAEAYVTLLYSAKDKSDTTLAENTRKEYIKANSLEVIDPLNVKAKINELKDEIDKFVNAVDSAISVSNALNTIEIEY